MSESLDQRHCLQPVGVEAAEGIPLSSLDTYELIAVEKVGVMATDGMLTEKLLLKLNTVDGRGKHLKVSYEAISLEAFIGQERTSRNRELDPSK